MIAADLCPLSAVRAISIYYNNFYIGVMLLPLRCPAVIVVNWPLNGGRHFANEFGQSAFRCSLIKVQIPSERLLRNLDVTDAVSCHDISKFHYNDTT